MSPEAHGPLLDDRSGVPDAWLRVVDFCGYDPATGEICSTGRMPAAALDHLAAESGHDYLAERGHPDLHFVDVSMDPRRRRVKSACPAVLHGLVLRELPRPCTIEISDPVRAPYRYPVDAPELELSFEHPGTYRVSVLSGPHTPGVFEVTV